MELKQRSRVRLDAAPRHGLLELERFCLLTLIAYTRAMNMICAARVPAWPQLLLKMVGAQCNVRRATRVNNDFDPRFNSVEGIVRIELRVSKSAVHQINIK